MQQGQHWWDAARALISAYFAVQWDYIEQDPGWCAILGTDTGNVLKSFGDTAFGKYQCLFYYWYFAGFTPEK